MIVIWDLDGTVWDSEPGILDSLGHALRSVEVAVPPPEELRGIIGPPLAMMLAELGVPQSRLDEAVRRYRERYLSAGVLEASLYPGVIEALEALAGAGHRLATATSKGEVPTRMMLEHFGLTGAFEVVGAASMDGRSATKRQVLGRTLEDLGAPEPSVCVMVGDRHYDVTGAAAFGIPCIGATWGYGGVEELRLAGAVALAARPLDVPPLVAGG